MQWSNSIFIWVRTKRGCCFLKHNHSYRGNIHITEADLMPFDTFWRYAGKTLPPWKKLIPLFRMGDFTTRSLQLLRLALLVYYVHHSPTSKNPNFLILWSPFILTTHFPRKSIEALLMWWIHKWWWVSWLSSNVFKGSTASSVMYWDKT